MHQARLAILVVLVVEVVEMAGLLVVQAPLVKAMLVAQAHLGHIVEALEAVALERLDLPGEAEAQQVNLVAPVVLVWQIQSTALRLFMLAAEVVALKVDLQLAPLLAAMAAVETETLAHQLRQLPERQILVAAVVVPEDLEAVRPQLLVALADLALSSFDTQFNWRSTWHILQK